MHVSVIGAGDKHPSPAHERPHCADDAEHSGQDRFSSTGLVFVYEVGDEDEEEAGTGGEGDQELEEVSLGEPVADGTARRVTSLAYSEL